MNGKLNPKVTVVIPAYKAERTIRRAIDSVLAQDGCDTKIIVIVNPEPDRVPEIVRSYGSPRLQVFVNAENSGAPFSRNRGLSIVEDEFVLFLDSDDFMEGPLLGVLARKMTEAGADLGLGPMQTFFEWQGRRGPTTILETQPVEELFTNWLGQGRFVVPCSVLWRTSFVRQIGGWDDGLRLSEDGELVMRAILLGAKVVGSDKGRGVYVIHDSPTRQTARTDTLDALLKIPEKLMSIASDIVEPAAMRRAAAASYYDAARTCFVRRRDDLGHEALRRSRQLGLEGHLGSKPERLLSALIGLRLRCRLEHAARRVFGRPGG